ncbi:MAG: pilus assembly protein [Actinobacteria bacterium]|nr:pilus assembly protein [Actinomycetota bacterium]
MAKSQADPHRGQAAVELALVMPVVVVFMLLILQVGLVVREQIALIHACGAAARAASIADSPDDAAHSVLDASSIGDGANIAVTTKDGMVTVDVVFDHPTDLAIVGFFLPDITLRASATYQLQG